MANLTILSEHRTFDGVQGFYQHESEACGGPMRFSLFLPKPALAGQRVPVLYYLAGLECNEQTFAIKAGAQRYAAQHGLALCACDTSPRLRLPGDDASWDFGLAASFYLDATVAPWSSAYQMRRYVAEELPALVEANFPLRPEARGLFGHSMGGHGALTLALTYPDRYRSVSAFAPIAAPSQVPWGQKALSGYLGPDRTAWAAYDTVALLAHRRFPGTLLVDQGLADKFLERELRPDLLEKAAAATGQPLLLRRHPGYDHSYYFVATFMGDHLDHHARALAGAS